jgi:hypothetical protein
MTRQILTTIGVALAALIGVAATVSIVLPTASFAAHYLNDAPEAEQALSRTALERGPPVGYDRTTTDDTIDRSSNGTSARPDIDTAPAVLTHGPSALFVQVASDGGMTVEEARGAEGRSVVPDRAGVAAKSADEAADIGHAGLRHQFPNTLKGKSQFYDDVNLGELASRTKGMDGFLQTNGNSRYVLRNPVGVGVDRTTGLPTDVFTVIRRPDGSVVTMFPGTSPKG